MWLRKLIFLDFFLRKRDERAEFRVHRLDEEPRNPFPKSYLLI